MYPFLMVSHSKTTALKFLGWRTSLLEMRGDAFPIRDMISPSYFYLIHRSFLSWNLLCPCHGSLPALITCWLGRL